MSCSHRDLLDAALSMPSETEALRRTAASRAYYAAYHAAKAYHQGLQSPGSVAFAKGGMHETLYTQLRYPTVKNSDVKTQSIMLGNLLMAAHTLRVHTDYKPEQDFLRAHANVAIDNAKVILKTTESVLTQRR